MKKLILLCVLILIGCSPKIENIQNPDRIEFPVDVMNSFEVTDYLGEKVTIYSIRDEVNNLQCWYLEGRHKASFSCLPFWMLFKENQYYAGILKVKEGGHGMSFDRYTVEITIRAVPSNYYNEVDVGDCIEIRCEPDETGGICVLQRDFEDPLSKYYPFDCEE